MELLAVVEKEMILSVTVLKDSLALSVMETMVRKEREKGREGEGERERGG